MPAMIKDIACVRYLIACSFEKDTLFLVKVTPGEIFI